VSSRHFGIQRKIFMAFGLFFSMVVAGGGWAVARYFTSVSRARIEQHQLNEVTLLARAMDETIAFYQQCLEGAAREIPPSTLLDHRSAARWLQARTSLRTTFPNGVFLVGPDGRLLTEAADAPQDALAPAPLRPFLDAVMANRQAGVSPPYDVASAGRPAVLMAVPLWGKDGQVLAVLAGGIDLLHDDFLGEIARKQLPDSGYLQLFDSKRRVLIHPDPARLMKSFDPPEPSELFDRALQGFEGSGERVNAAGVPTISSLKRLQAMDGILVASLPVAEALRPVERLRSYLKLAVALVVAMSLFLTWLISHRLADNLEDITHQVRALGDLPAGNRIIRIRGNDEVSVLAESFNAMIGRLEAKERSLTRARAETDEELAITKHLLRRLVEPGLRALPPGFHMETLQTRRINGDACTYRQGLPGVHFGFLCDATGHGLAAGVSTLPAVQAFLSMANRNIPLDTAYRQINARLREMLPSGRFVCLMLMRLDVHKGTLSILNAGLPDALLLPRHGPPRRIASHNLPAGVVDRLDAPVVEQIAVSEGDRLFAFTDGLQDMLGERLQSILAPSGKLPFPACQKAIQEALAADGLDREQQDDASWALWEVPAPASARLSNAARPAGDSAEPLRTIFALDFILNPREQTIREFLPDCLRLLGNQGLPSGPSQRLALALTEALANAVDHGLLRLDPRLKEGGIEAYEAARHAGLEALTEGTVSLRISLRAGSHSGIREIAVEVEDSGPGFNWRAWQEQAGQAEPPMAGRGLLTLRALSRDLGFNAAGNALRFTLSCG
jgi:anti-sigma regulatory factor (Ser/Thr protein kinase)/HAMP domain-containing protein